MANLKQTLKGAVKAYAKTSGLQLPPKGQFVPKTKEAIGMVVKLPKAMANNFLGKNDPTVGMKKRK